MKILNSIKEKFATAVSPAKLIEKSEKKAIQAPSPAKACIDTKCAIESIKPVNLTSNANVKETLETLRALNANKGYKKVGN